MPEAYYHVAKNVTIKKSFEEGRSKTQKKVNRKSKKEDNRKEKGKGKRKCKGKHKDKSKGKEIKPGKNEFDWGIKDAPYEKEECSSVSRTLFLMHFLLLLILMRFSNFLSMKLICMPNKMVENSTLTNKKRESF